MVLATQPVLVPLIMRGFFELPASMHPQMLRLLLEMPDAWLDALRLIRRTLARSTAAPSRRMLVDYSDDDSESSSDEW